MAHDFIAYPSRVTVIAHRDSWLDHVEKRKLFRHNRPGVALTNLGKDVDTVTLQFQPGLARAGRARVGRWSTVVKSQGTSAAGFCTYMRAGCCTGTNSGSYGANFGPQMVKELSFNVVPFIFSSLRRHAWHPLKRNTEGTLHRKSHY